eukprot:TRINITY_DN64650_c0_g1_i1.p1 TRINITY_DN64650_c0_g1~~TRINITY_DN64650_c0_g1_i1.p1  ORF type:complete len:264 (-),score=35.66 TRINITY_DN64650_c0_g1_i1:121-912(-)
MSSVCKLAVLLGTFVTWHGALARRAEEGDYNIPTLPMDLVTCDQICVSCPSGRDILITRQKSKAALVGVAGAGAVSFGLAAPIANQLVGCPHIGFEFWNNTSLEPEQPFRSTASKKSFGMIVTPGLKSLKKETRKRQSSGSDWEALIQCDKFRNTYSWHIRKGVRKFKGPASHVERIAKKCLQHTLLCGPSEALKNAKSIVVSSKCKVPPPPPPPPAPPAPPSQAAGATAVGGTASASVAQPVAAPSAAPAAAPAQAVPIKPV